MFDSLSEIYFGIHQMYWNVRRSGGGRRLVRAVDSKGDKWCDVLVTQDIVVLQPGRALV